MYNGIEFDLSDRFRVKTHYKGFEIGKAHKDGSMRYICTANKFRDLEKILSKQAMIDFNDFWQGRRSDYKINSPLSSFILSDEKGQFFRIPTNDSINLEMGINSPFDMSHYSRYLEHKKTRLGVLIEQFYTLKVKEWKVALDEVRWGLIYDSSRTGFAYKEKLLFTKKGIPESDFFNRRVASVCFLE